MIFLSPDWIVLILMNPHTLYIQSTYNFIFEIINKNKTGTLIHRKLKN